MTKRRVLPVAVILGLIGVVWGRTLIEARSEVGLARQFQSQRMWSEAITHWDRAAHWYSPGNPYVEEALESLWSAGQGLESEDPSNALLAYDAIRGSLKSTRHLIQPHAEWLSRANERISVLRAQEEVRLDPKKDLAVTTRRHRELLLKDERPRVGWTLLVQLGFFGWIACTIAWIFKGFDAKGSMSLRRSVPWMIGMVAGFAIWIAGLLNA